MPDLDVLIPSTYSLAVLRWALPSGREATVNIGIRKAGGIGDQACADDLYDQTWNVWDNVTDSGYGFRPTVIYTNTGAGVTTAIAAGTNHAGTVAQSSAPCELNLCIRKRTAFIGKGFRGRSYWPVGLAEANVDEGGQLTAGSITTYTNTINTWVANLLTPAGTVEGFYLFRNPTPDVAEPDLVPRVPVLIESWDVSPLNASQRRRRARI